MRRLVLMRHCQAVASAPGGRDADRPLSPQGLSDAGRMGKALAQAGYAPDHALVSSAVRTRQTWDEIREAFGDVEVAFDEAIYTAGPRQLRDDVETLEEVAGTLILIGHNPAVHQCAVDLLTEGAAAPSVIERLTSGFPPGAAALFLMDAAGRAVWDGFIRPSDLEG